MHQSLNAQHVAAHHARLLSSAWPDRESVCVDLWDDAGPLLTWSPWRPDCANLAYLGVLAAAAVGLSDATGAVVTTATYQAEVDEGDEAALCAGPHVVRSLPGCRSALLSEVFGDDPARAVLVSTPYEELAGTFVALEPPEAHTPGPGTLVRGSLGAQLRHVLEAPQGASHDGTWPITCAALVLALARRGRTTLVDAGSAFHDAVMGQLSLGPGEDRHAHHANLEACRAAFEDVLSELSGIARPASRPEDRGSLSWGQWSPKGRHGSPEDN